MTLKIVTSLLGLTLLLNSIFSLSAQPTAADIAEEEAVRRQEAIQLLHMRLNDAQALHQTGRFVEAAKVYEDAYALFPQVASSATEDRKAVVAGLAETRLKLATDAQKRGDLQEADAQIKRALKVAPQNANVLALKLENDKIMLNAKGNIPSSETLALIPQVQNEKIQTGTLVQDGKLLFEMGKNDAAEAKLKLALQQDPSHAAAKYYLDLIKEKRYLNAALQRDTSSKDKMVEVEEAWNSPVKRDQLPFPNPLTRTNLIHTSPQRQEIMSKLNSIRLNEVSYDGLNLVDVLKHLTDEAIKRDPDKQGLNFMISSHSEGSAALPPANPGDPLAPVAEVLPAVDISTVTIKINPPLRNLRLKDVLDAIVSSADANQPIRYELRDYAVVFSAKPLEVAPLYSRNFKIDPNTFVQGLESVVALSLGENIGGTGGQGGGGGGGSGSQQNGVLFNVPRVQLSQITGGGGAGRAGVGQGLNYVTRTNTTAGLNEMVRTYFATAGVDLTPPKSVFFNDRSGILFVRATLQDLETIETAVQVLNTAPPQVQIEAKFTEVTQSDSKGIGFDWHLGNFLLGNGKIGSQAGTAPSFAGVPSTANPSGSFPGPGIGGPGSVGPATIAPSATDGKLTTGIRNAFGDKAAPLPELATITGILTDPQFRMVLRAIDQRAGVDVLASPKVTTISGRQAQISALDLRTIVTGIDVENNTSSQASPTGGNQVIQNSQPTFEVTTQPMPFGPALDVIPYVSSDGYSIQMTLIPTMTEFVEYEDPGLFSPTAFTSQGDAAKAALPLPRLRIRQVTTSCIVYDGQTVVLGGLIAENIVKIKDKVPMLGDIPYLGRLFRSESKTSDKRNLVIFVTPTILDPAGNRVHSDEELPFARTSVPTQTTQ